VVKVAQAEQYYGDGAAVQVQKKFASLEERVKQLEVQAAVVKPQLEDLVKKLEEIRQAFVKQKKGAKSGS